MLQWQKISNKFCLLNSCALLTLAMIMWTVPPVPCKQALSSPSYRAKPQIWLVPWLPCPLLCPRSLSQCHQLQPLPQHLSQSSIASSRPIVPLPLDQRLLASINSHLQASPLSEPSLEQEPTQRLMVLWKGEAEQSAMHPSEHLFICEECGRCKCVLCTAARPLPPCLPRHLLLPCLLESLLDYGTCLCCVKGLFYHCSTDDEDNCADEPCSCGPGSCFVRWAAMSLISLLTLPVLLPAYLWMPPSVPAGLW